MKNVWKICLLIAIARRVGSTAPDPLTSAPPKALPPGSTLGQEVAVPRHLLDGEEFTLPLADLLDHGELLFSAMWTSPEGAGRPLTKGVSFGTIARHEDGTWNTGGVKGLPATSLRSDGPENPPSLLIRPVHQAAIIEFLKTLQVLPPGTPHLVVDEAGNPKPWPPR